MPRTSQRALVRLSVSCVLALTAPALAPGPASAQLSIGTASGCKRLGNSARQACLKCVGTGNFYQTQSGVCGMDANMRKVGPSMPELSGPPPKPPKQLSRFHTAYVRIDPGSFTMGAPETDREANTSKEMQHTVELSRPFEMKTTEVTHGEWHVVTGKPSPSYDAQCGQDCPVGSITWREALEYLNQLSKRAKLEACYDLSQPDKVTWKKGLDCKGYRLPTEAEWEYAARAGSGEPRHGPVDEVAWHNENVGRIAARPVAKKAANAWGLHDMLGNVSEWVWDEETYEDPPATSTDPIAAGLEQSFPAKVIIRGGNFFESSTNCRVSARAHYLTDMRWRALGFRPVRTLDK